MTLLDYIAIGVLGLGMGFGLVSLAWTFLLFDRAARSVRQRPELPRARVVDRSWRPSCSRCGKTYDPRLDRCLCTWCRFD